ncbi:hypothetical protein Taro_030492 [Colocasia esculenta]|uniref:Uncharacterized protein n=1 Tax=Colocasia esculenta TaxID=4460 RepID=A0A843VY28_COLES|nr:hypothetical protein [Colocasia esculenta]
MGLRALRSSSPHKFSSSLASSLRCYNNAINRNETSTGMKIKRDRSKWNFGYDEMGGQGGQGVGGRRLESTTMAPRMASNTAEEGCFDSSSAGAQGGKLELVRAMVSRGRRGAQAREDSRGVRRGVSSRPQHPKVPQYFLHHHLWTTACSCKAWYRQCRPKLRLRRHCRLNYRLRLRLQLQFPRSMAMVVRLSWRGSRGWLRLLLRGRVSHS